MEVNNTVYETSGHRWWNEDAGFEMTSLRYCLNPVRYAYFKRILREGSVYSGTVLDIGCGGVSLGRVCQGWIQRVWCGPCS